VNGRVLDVVLRLQKPDMVYCPVMSMQLEAAPPVLLRRYRYCLGLHTATQTLLRFHTFALLLVLVSVQATIEGCSQYSGLRRK
jgi:hypothetical protein